LSFPILGSRPAVEDAVAGVAADYMKMQMPN